MSDPAAPTSHPQSAADPLLELTDANAVRFEIELEVVFAMDVTPVHLPVTLGPVRDSPPGKIRVQGETTLQITWSPGAQRSWYGRISSTWEQNSLRTLLDEFRKYSSQLLRALDAKGRNTVVRCELVQYPNTEEDTRQHVPGIEWENQATYFARVRGGWRRELPTIGAVFVALILANMMFSSRQGVLENAIYGALLGSVSGAVNLLLVPLFANSKGLVLRAARN